MFDDSFDDGLGSDTSEEFNDIEEDTDHSNADGLTGALDALSRSGSFAMTEFASMDEMGLVDDIRRERFNRVMDVAGDMLCGDMALICLRAYKWKQDRLMEDVLDGVDSVLEKVGVVVANEGSEDLTFQDDRICYLCGQRSEKKRLPLTLREGTLNPLHPKYDAAQMESLCPVCCLPLPKDAEAGAAAAEEMFECPVCWNDVPMSKTFALGCGHRYCEECWTNYLKERILSPGNLESVCSHCMGKECMCPVPESVFARFVRDPKLVKRYAEQSLRHFVSVEPHYKWCPYPGCNAVVRVDTLSITDPVTCSFCGNTYCFHCSDPEIGDHRPCLCEQMRKWKEKATNESENINWLTANTKRCPKCHAAIEKNGGCMHMTCNKQSGGCGYEFCWMCRGPWSEHGSATGGYYSCNRYDKSAAKKEDMAAEKAKSDLDYYMFFYHRYDSHKMACKTVVQQLHDLPRRQDALMRTFHVQAAETRFLEEALRALIQFLRALQFSYAYGYYLGRKSPKMELFQYLQENLEKFTNHLTELCEMRIDKITDFFRWKEEIINYTRVTTKYLDNFSHGVAGGL